MPRKEQISDAIAALYIMARMEVDRMSPAEKDQLLEDTADYISSATDTLVSGAQPDRKKPSSLAAVAHGVALMAEAEGGVTVFGRHYCTRPHLGCDGNKMGSAC